MVKCLRYTLFSWKVLSARYYLHQFVKIFIFFNLHGIQKFQILLPMHFNLQNGLFLSDICSLLPRTSRLGFQHPGCRHQTFKHMITVSQKSIGNILCQISFFSKDFAIKLYTISPWVPEEILMLCGGGLYFLMESNWLYTT